MKYILLFAFVATALTAIHLKKEVKEFNQKPVASAEIFNCLSKNKMEDDKICQLEI